MLERRGLTTKLATLLLVVLVVLSLMLPISKVQASKVQDKILFILTDDALSMLQVERPSVVTAVLTIPGVTVLSSTASLVGDQLRVGFDISKYIRDISESIDILSEYPPSFSVTIKDYESGKTVTILVSSFTEYLRELEESEENKRVKPSDLLLRAVNMTRSDPLQLLYKDVVVIDDSYIDVLMRYGRVSIQKTPSVSLDALRSMGLPVGPEQAQCDTSDATEYPYPGTGVYQVVDTEKYSELVYNGSTEVSVPDWWRERYVDNTNSYTMEDMYKRFVKDLLASYYLVDKSVHPSRSDAIDAVFDYLVYGKRNGGNALPTMAVDPDLYFWSDDWNDTFDPGAEYIDLPLLAYSVDSESLKPSDGSELELRILFVFVETTARINALMFMGDVVFSSDDIHVTGIHYDLDIDFNEHDRLSGAFIAEDTLITLGEDRFLIHLLVDDKSCPGYYIITPVVTMTTLYSVSLSADNVVYVRDPGKHATEYFPASMFASLTGGLIDELTTLPNGTNDVLTNPVNISSQHNFSNVTYDALIDVPPLINLGIQTILTLCNHPVAKVLSLIYSVLTSIGTFSVDIQARYLAVSLSVAQEDPVSDTIVLSIEGYMTNLRHYLLTSNSNNNVTKYYNAIHISATYADSGGPGCIGGFCPVTSSP